MIAAVACVVLVTATLIAADIDLKKVKCLMRPKAGAKAGQSVEYKDSKVFFCCGNCLKKFSGSPKKFATSANQQLVATKQFEQKKCPLTGGKLNLDTAISVGTVKVAFCCNNCKGKISKAKDATDLVFNDKAFAKGFAKVKATKTNATTTKTE
jgi:YHS domain-containing protein